MTNGETRSPQWKSAETPERVDLGERGLEILEVVVRIADDGDFHRSSSLPRVRPQYTRKSGRMTSRRAAWHAS